MSRGLSRTQHEPVPENVERAATQVVDAAFTVHFTLGPGLLENVYEICLFHELTKRDLKVKRQVVLPVVYDDIRLDAGLRLDLLVEDTLIVEIKAVADLLPVYQAQLLTYLKLTALRLGLLINFNTVRIRDGIKRLVL